MDARSERSDRVLTYIGRGIAEADADRPSQRRASGRRAVAERIAMRYAPGEGKSMDDTRKGRSKGLVLKLVAAALTAAVALGAFAILQGHREAKVRLVSPFEDPTWKAAMGSEVDEFGALFKRCRVETTQTDFAGALSIVASAERDWDVAIGSAAFLDSPALFAEPPEPLTGSLWGIYCNRRVLERAGIGPKAGDPGLAGRLAAGEYSIEDLGRACAAVKAGGAVPIALGSRFVWPLAVWIQAFMAAGGSVDEAARLPEPGFDPASPALQGAIAAFSSFIEAGYVQADHAARDWPASLRSVVQGKAAFCLVNEEFVASLRPEERKSVAYLPLPGSAAGGKARWAMGSLVYIGRSRKAAGSEAAGRLLEYLTSPGATERLALRTGAPFFAAGRGPGRMIPSVSSASQHPVMTVIEKALVRRH